MQSLRTLLPRAAPSLRAAFSTTTPRPLAKMQIIGRLVDQPEQQATSTGRDITRFAVAVSSGPKGEDGNRPTSFYRVASFIEGPSRDVLLGLEKGQQIYVEADARMDTFEADGPDGRIKRTQLNLLMRNFEALARPVSHSSQPEHVGDEGASALASA